MNEYELSVIHFHILTHHIPLHMSLFDITYACSHPPGYLLLFYLRFLPLNSYHILMLTVLLTLSVPLWCLVLILSAPYLPGQHVPHLLPLGYLLFSANIVLNSGLQKWYGANHKILLTLIFIDHSSLTSLLMSPLLKGHTIVTKLKNCLIWFPLDPIPSHLLQAISLAVIPALTHIVNTSLHIGIFPSAFKQALITSLLRASQEPHSSGLTLTSQIGPSKYLGEVRCPSRNT